jgi:hypothetical protein
MHFKITAISDSAPEWNEKTELWWTSGGALLWNRFGGAGSEELVLDRRDLDEFLAGAAAIPGWTAPDAGTALSQGPLRISEFVENEAKSVTTYDSGRCCDDCGRPWHSSLGSEAVNAEVRVSAKKLNHVILALEEAIAFAKGEGANNYRTWEALLKDFLPGVVTDE